MEFRRIYGEMSMILMEKENPIEALASLIVAVWEVSDADNSILNTTSQGYLSKQLAKRLVNSPSPLTKKVIGLAHPVMGRQVFLLVHEHGDGVYVVDEGLLLAHYTSVQQIFRRTEEIFLE